MGTKASQRNLSFSLDKYDTRNIYRHDKIRMYGWWLKVQRNGEQFSKFFSDSKYWNNAECSLLAAIHERDEFIRDRSEKEPKLPFRQHTLSNNSTGINGVSFAKSEGKRGAFVASWKLPDGRNKNKKFNINKYGFHEALRLAIEARQKWEDEMRRQFLDENGLSADNEYSAAQQSGATPAADESATDATATAAAEPNRSNMEIEAVTL